MKRAVLAVLGLLAATLASRAQVQVDSVFFDARGSFVTTVVPGAQPSATLTGDFLNFNAWGKITPSLSYRIRQNFRVPVYKEGNPLNGTEFLLLNWDINPRWSLNAGKLCTLVGSFEWDYTPIDVYYYNQFCNSVPEAYALGGTVMYNLRPGQQLQLQASRSILSYGEEGHWALALGWIGSFAPWWHTLWAVTYLDDPYHHHMAWFGLGNRFLAGPFSLDLDLMYRRSLLPGVPSGPDASVSVKAAWQEGKWLFFVKGGGDYNDPGNVDGDDIPYDLVLAPGTRYVYAGGGVEYYPLGNKNLRLHTVGRWNNDSRVFTLSAGISFRLYMVKPH